MNGTDNEKKSSNHTASETDAKSEDFTIGDCNVSLSTNSSLDLNAQQNEVISNNAIFKEDFALIKAFLKETIWPVVTNLTDQNKQLSSKVQALSMELQSLRDGVVEDNNQKENGQEISCQQTDQVVNAAENQTQLVQEIEELKRRNAQLLRQLECHQGIVFAKKHGPANNEKLHRNCDKCHKTIDGRAFESFTGGLYHHKFVFFLTVLHPKRKGLIGQKFATSTNNDGSAVYYCADCTKDYNDEQLKIAEKENEKLTETIRQLTDSDSPSFSPSAINKSDGKRGICSKCNGIIIGRAVQTSTRELIHLDCFNCDNCQFCFVFFDIYFSSMKVGYIKASWKNVWFSIRRQFQKKALYCLHESKLTVCDNYLLLMFDQKNRDYLCNLFLFFPILSLFQFARQVFL
ncbi:hypothetical protein RFI_27722 [Reticulomyxa filosa]|uniref:LIM zinc-binding domain-containing protein n=1 Tax=Reticulomyxa filosa TaxID=46433 RepID=X6M861_RETFI|nr:hypothetical protein RFI_27722 [Reticulomyxa filosa]|eukprot:ETO09652.1 hypothetical protein RFI_27722 [Reticulomyxa filosa]